MAGGLKDTIADAEDMEKVMAKSSITIGKVEAAQIKLTKSIYNAPFVKTGLAIGTVMVGLNRLFKSTNKSKEGKDKLKNVMEEEGTILSKLVVVMTMYGGAAKLAGKGTTTLGKAMFSLVSSMLFLFGIFGLLAIGAMMLAVAFADVNSPLMAWLTDMPVIGEMMNGLKIVMTGEDGESGLKGATDVLVLALIAGGLAFLVFGAPVGILVATLIGVVGIFNWLKAKTGSTVVALMGAGAILMVGLTALSIFIPGLAATTVASILLPFALLLASLTIIWLSLTGELNYWWGVAAAIGAVVAAGILYAVLFGATMAMLPVVLIAAAAAAIIFTIVYFWDDIVAFFVAAWDWFAGLMSDIGTGIGDAWDGMWAYLGDAWSSVGEFFSGIGDWFAGIPSAISNWFGNAKDTVVNGAIAVKDGIVNKVKEFFAWIGDKWKAIKAAPGRLLTAIMNLVKIPVNGLSKFWNKRVAGIIPEMSIPDWVPGIGGGSFGPFPGKMRMFAEGGMVHAPTLGMIGEAGPEAVIPLKGGNVPVKLSGQQYSDRTMKEMIRAVSAAVSQHGNTFNFNIDVSGLVATNDQAKRDFADELSKIIQENIMKQRLGLMKSTSKSVGSWF